ncbi:hypothetical protein [Moellerella wisconsensis]|uniref:Uncharacterized protein n=1 Tax=Moellerella wisconsensis TaxID=158849 RepID=A0ACD3Y8U4_9GAMM|nr:hypothetical protein [Moellerella wisconsensis]KLN97667.1 hypothetical protein VK86_03150 [Moellerella wisconsensis]UNH24674.1 hypothetical protein MNY68_02615 [Moellerella wisconsensis]UNH39400.1 hypothetical protein MNY70_02635 [Moellerella wisconsensis]UNH42923.1 hypothetical protein MNY66_02615 [Moellerella wisconsensis]WJW82373.1 hypothetical protein QU516_02620 [Moellerella wisconsensis]
MESNIASSAVTITLNARLESERRIDLQDAITQVMEKLDKEIYVIGGETLLSEHGEPEKCKIQLAVDDANGENISLILQMISSMISPKGSKLHINNDEAEIEFGHEEGLAIYINGSDLGEDVYQNSDINEVIERCDELIEDIGTIQGTWDGSTETALYFYGESFAAMVELLQPYLDSEPLCQKARLVQIA